MNIVDSRFHPLNLFFLEKGVTQEYILTCTKMNLNLNHTKKHITLCHGTLKRYDASVECGDDMYVGPHSHLCMEVSAFLIDG